MSVTPPRAESRRNRDDVVIVTPTYLSSNPRVVKEADALAAAGWKVTVVFSQGPAAWARTDDALLTASRPWSARAVRWSPTERGERGRYWRSTCRMHAAGRLEKLTGGPLWLSTRAACRTYPELARAAAEVPARLYVGHYPEGLAAAAWAAERRNARLAYDVEDLHTAEAAPSVHACERSRRVAQIEKAHIGRCSYVSAVSAGVAGALVERYGAMPAPIVVHNAFPWSDRASIEGNLRDRKGPAVSVYWYSQVIGLDRGLQDAIRALGRIQVPYQVHIRGYCDDDAASQLRALAIDTGVGERLFVHGRVPPDELLARTSEHDIGLALEPPISENRRLTASNKVFLYLLGGLAVVATATPGQQAVLAHAPGAADLYPPGDIDALARILERLLTDRRLLAQRKAAALAAAETRWNWELEQRPLLAEVSRALGARDLPRQHDEAVAGASSFSSLPVR